MFGLGVTVLSSSAPEFSVLVHLFSFPLWGDVKRLLFGIRSDILEFINIDLTLGSRPYSQQVNKMISVRIFALLKGTLISDDRYRLAFPTCPCFLKVTPPSKLLLHICGSNFIDFMCTTKLPPDVECKFQCQKLHHYTWKTDNDTSSIAHQP